MKRSECVKGHRTPGYRKVAKTLTKRAIRRDWKRRGADATVKRRYFGTA